MQNSLEKVLELTIHPYAIFSSNGNCLFQNAIFASFDNVIMEGNSMNRNTFIDLLVEKYLKQNHSEKICFESNQKQYQIEFHFDTTNNSTFCIGTDITELVIAEKKIEKNENRIEILINNSEHSLLMEDENRKIVFTNQKFVDLFGIPASPDQMIGADCSESAEQSKEFFKNPAQFVSRINHLLEKREICEKEILETVTNRTLERNYCPIFINNKYSGHLWSYKETTDEIQLKKGIEEQRNFYQSVLNNIPADIAVFSKEHVYLFVNKIGIKNKEIREWIIGKKDEDYAVYRNRPMSIFDARRNYFNQAMASRKIVSWEEEIKLTDNESQYVLRNFFPFVTENEEIELVVGYGIDITNRKRVEKQLIENLEKEKRLTESKSNFITTVSHEIRTPLSIISLSSEAMQMYCENLQGPFKQKFESKLNQIISEIERLTNIISEVITIEKIESGSFSLVKQSLNFRDFIKTLVDRQSRIQDDGRKASLRISGNPQDIYADKMKLTIAIDNILANAFKYSNKMPPPLVTVKFNLKKIQIKITDFGLGIPESYLSKLFKLFERADNVTHIRGTGMGLFLVKQIIELHHGDIQYSPNPKGGSIFTIHLPYK